MLYHQDFIIKHHETKMNLGWNLNGFRCLKSNVLWCKLVNSAWRQPMPRPVKSCSMLQRKKRCLVGRFEECVNT